MSELGADCDRALWYRLRWADANEPTDGRKARLFETGNREEARLVDELKAIGIEVWEVDPDSGKQWPLRGAGDHVRGKADGVVLGLPEAPKTPHLLEIKSHSAKNFATLVKKGVQEAYPKHYAQCQLGMHLLGLDRAIYIATCKDTDELHAQRLDCDIEFCLRALARAERVIGSDRAPAKLHDDPASKAAFACAFCPALAVCHGKQFPPGDASVSPANCRTCLHAAPVAGGVWNCARFSKPLTLDEQKQGCPAHLFLPDLVPGEQIDASEDDETVTYRLIDGRVWIDGGEVVA